ncbi:haloacid dehalogenase type II [Amphritea pacifica]|uniref:(S)-2-haloacid dehalogenase n=1 Tax=Amphritea pacifica TaxID=2811233 RepID=A0ABS2W8I2_9GAMM|nr:haloacid dehalogenase type II [Amphritea pacifica]MBN0988023.1 haloacid dehalogenase type II [Amphritea pacifica]
MHRQTFAFDVYGTLVDPLEMGRHLQMMVGDKASDLARIWREKQVEYAFRRGLMGRYEPFNVCTLQALEYALGITGLSLTTEQQQFLMAQYQQLATYSDVIPAIESLRAQGHYCVAFSNGPADKVRALLNNVNVLELLDDVVSVDEIKRYKPDPAVYLHLLNRTASRAGDAWLISSNAWDVMGAKHAGLNAAWIQRDPAAVFDFWDISPDKTVNSLQNLAEEFSISNGLE